MACSKYTITNSSSILTNFNYRRCDDSLWEYQAELGPNETKNIWTIDGTYSTAFGNNIIIDGVTEYPIIPTPVPYNQTALVYGLNQNNRWVYGILNFTNQGVIGNIDLGVSSDYDITRFELTNAGYGLTYTHIDTGEANAIFMNSDGNIIERYEINTDNYDDGSTNGTWYYFQDNNTGVFKYFNGTYVGTYNWDSSSGQDLSVIGSTSTGALIINVQNSGSTETIELLAPGGIVNTIRTNDTTIATLNVLTYFDGDFILILDRNDGINWSSLEIYDSSGTTLLQNISLTGSSYIGNASTYFYGNNKVTIVLFDDSGPGEHYIINYNGNTNTLITTTVDAVTYPEYFTYYRENYAPSVSPSENMYILFYGQLDTPDKSLYPVDYAKILSFIDESPTVDSYVFQNSGTFNKSFSTANGISNTLFLPVDNGDGILSMLSFNTSGHTITSTGLPISGITDIAQVESFGDNCYMRIPSTGTCSERIFVFDSNGLLRDSLIGQFGTDSRVSYNTLYVRDNSSLDSCGVDKTYYINNQNSGFTETDIFFGGGAYSQSLCYIPNFTYNGALLMYDGAALTAKIITPSSVSETFQIKNSNYIRGGTNYFMDFDEISGSTIYDFNGNIINTNNQQGDFTCGGYCYGAVSSRYFYSNEIGANSITNLSGPNNNGSITTYTNSGSTYNIILNDSVYQQF